MPTRYPREVVTTALRLMDEGRCETEVADVCGLRPPLVRQWRLTYHQGGELRWGGRGGGARCPRCEGGTLDAGADALLLGWYLGDGHIALARGVPRLLAIDNDVTYVDLNAEIEATLRTVTPNCRVWRRNRPGCLAICASWDHWTCLFPRHGAGPEHRRAIVLEPWQQEIVDAHPARLLRGLIHSDGCRLQNWATTADGVRYDGYLRYFFTNSSADIRAPCCAALDRLQVRHSHPSTLSVAILDQHVGPKS